ncbi:MAG TPA: VWA domain-containing protein [Deltaproteobacteria bacterium]|nr:VWA domain-containing protein [Deltaproteobacteria bacterium]
MTEMYFDRPYLLSTAAAAPVVLFFFLYALRARRADLSRLWLRGPAVVAAGKSAVAVAAALVLLAVAAAGPRVGEGKTLAGERAEDVVIAIDASRSMSSLSGGRSRFELAVDAASHLLDILEGARVGLVIFSYTAAGVSPLTRDEAALKVFLGRLDQGVMKSGATSLEAALEESMKLFDDETRSRNIVIFTDGGDESIRGSRVLGEAMNRRVRVFTVGVGEGASPVPVLSATGSVTGYKLDEAGRRVMVGVNRPVLDELSRMTGGIRYEVGADDHGDLYALAERLMALGELEGEPREEVRYSHRFGPLVLAALALVAAAGLMPGSRPRPQGLVRHPEARRLFGGPSSPGTAAVLIAAAVAALGMGLRDDFQRALEEGRSLYREGRYEEAEQSFLRAGSLDPGNILPYIYTGMARFRNAFFEDAVKSFKQAVTFSGSEHLAVAYYDLGCALFRDGDYFGALVAFKEALRLDPDDGEARHNYEVCLNVMQLYNLEKPDTGHGEQIAEQRNKAPGEENEVRVETESDDSIGREKLQRRFMEDFGEMNAEGEETGLFGEFRELTPFEAENLLDEAAEDELERFRILLGRRVPRGSPLSGRNEW